MDGVTLGKYTIQRLGVIVVIVIQAYAAKWCLFATYRCTIIDSFAQTHKRHIIAHHTITSSQICINKRSLLTSQHTFPNASISYLMIKKIRTNSYTISIQFERSWRTM